MPTFDSAPSNVEWLQKFIDADSAMVYSEWAIDILKKETGGRMNIISAASPGVDLDVFKPTSNLQQSRLHLGLPQDANIVGTTMRNQKRKLFPDLFIAFREYLERCTRVGRIDLVKNTYLYCHTSYPDVGWRIPQLLKENNISHKVFFTYVCKQCGKFFCTKFQDVRTVCKHCGSPSAVFPSTNQGLSEEELANVYQCMDLYIQYAVCEGAGMPQQEATACGVPIMSVNYSAMADTVRITEGIPLPPLKLIRDVDVNANRATPDNTDCADQLYKFFTRPIAMRKRMGHQARQKTEEYFNWDRIAKVWADHFDSIELTGVQGKWDQPPTIHKLPQQMPHNHEKVTNREFVQWLTTHVLHDPDEMYTYRGMKMLQELHWGARRVGNQMVPFTREQLFQQLLNHMANKNQYEQARCGQIQLAEEDFVEYAKMKKQIYG
jgi:glycosyltransferase involved in cell wall biosynthesis